MLLDTDENSGFNSNESSNDFNIDILQKIQSDIRSEWERPDEPGINFFLLLAALLLLVIWVVFISFFFSRLLGLLVGIGFQRFLKWSGVSNVSHLSIGSFSISILSGKVMIRNFLLITDDYTLRVNDGWVILSYWKYVPKKSSVQQCMNVSRLHVSLNGVKFHVFNRIAVYQGIAKQTGLSSLFANLINSAATNATGKDGATATSNNQSGKTTKNSEKLEIQLDAWWDKLWRLFGSIRFDISSGRFMAGNHLLPAAFALTFENFQSKILLTDPSNQEEDRYMFRMRATVENVRASLVKSTDYSAIKAGAAREDPPRTMGEGFAILQTAMVQLYYHQDLLGIVKDEVQSLTQKTPVWETVWRLDKNTVISYGPWADKQRALIYSFFFPSDYGCSPVTEMPKKGERRILLSHDVRVSLVRDATIDFWFMRNEELNAIHSRVKQGSSFEFYIPWTTTETGFTSTIRGSLLCLEATTSLPFREFIKCETMRFNVTSHYPRAYNHQQTWDLVFELHRFSTHLLWDHKRFIVDLINEWTRGEEVDLCKFIPCIWNFNISVVDKFEIVLLLNEKNWVDTSSSETSENLQAAVVGSQLYMNFALVFTEFGAETTSFELDMKVEDQVAVRIHLPPGNTLEPIFAALVKSANTQQHMKPSSVFVSVANDETWIEIWRTESICMKCEYEYHEGSTSKFKSDIPSEWIQKWLPPKLDTPSKLEPDNLFFQVDIGGSEAQLSGLLLKLILELKDNYFGVYDQISDVSKKPLYSANMITTSNDQLDIKEYRPMNAFFKLQLHNFRAHCLVHKPLLTEQYKSGQTKGFCPVINIDQILVELKKDHTEALVQVMVGPSKLHFLEPDLSMQNSSKSLGSCSLDSLQFRGHGLYSDLNVPWAVECMEYAWLVEVLVGQIHGKISPQEFIQIIQFLDSFIVLALAVDESMEVPERFNICHHFHNIRVCPYSDLKIIDSKNRSQSCESSEALKYRLVRVSIDRLNLFIVDELSCAMQLEVDNTRLSFCNAHLGSFAENLIVQLPKIEISQYISVHETRWLKCGAITIEKNCLDVRLPYKPKVRYMPEERRKFLQSHDKVSNRLYFLWRKNDKTCACFGDCRFFAKHDILGSNFHIENLSPLAIADIRQDINDQPAYLQCILTPHSCGIRMSDKFADSTLSVPSSLNSRYTSTELEANEENDHMERKMSEGSFHSAASHRGYSTSETYNHLQAIAYMDFLEAYDIHQQNQENNSNPAFLVKKVSNGISGIKLMRKDDPKKPHKSEQPITNSQLSLLKAEDWAKDPASFYLRGSLGSKLEIFVSPLSLSVVERFTHLTGSLLKATHPAYLAQKAYKQCSTSRHSQPLTASIIFRRQEKSFSPTSIRISLLVPNLNMALVQCKQLQRLQPENPSSPKPSINEEINSVALLSMAPLCVEVTTTNNPNEERKLSISTQHEARDKSDLGMFHFEVLQLIDSTKYDIVYNKVPVIATTNWSILAPELEEPLQKLRPKVVLDVQIPQLNFGMCVPLGETSKRDSSTTNVSRSITNLELRVDALNVTAVLGKSMESHSKHPQLKEEELTFFEVLTPLINSWILAGYKCSQQISRTLKAVDEWKDLTFTKLLADALDWHDDQVLLPERTKLMEEVKLHSRNMNSCPSCKLILNLLHYVAQNGEAIYEHYSAAVDHCSNELRNKERRKMAIIALLSHWQTLICNEVQLADNILAQKYKYNANRRASSVLQSGHADNNVVWQSSSSTKTEKVSSKDAKNSTAVQPADAKNGVFGILKGQRAGTPIPGEAQERLAGRNSSTPPPATLAVAGSNTSATPFVPGHRRGPSTASQMTAAENEPQDLYHRILKAQKEYKEQKEQQRQQQTSTTDNRASSSAEMNPMELILCVFFWNLYQDYDLEVSVLDSIPQKDLAMEYSLQLTELKVNVVEKKYLVSQRNEMLVALSSHHLITLENLELNGQGSLVVRMDEHNLRPAWANAAVEYNCKMQNMRLVVSLVSMFFINDLTQFIRTIVFAVNNLVRTSAVNKALTKKEIRRELSWATNVLNKLYDYERCCPAHRQEVLHINIIGNWALKMATFESMITDLFISMTLLKIGFNQKHTRIHSSCQAIKIMRTSTLLQQPNCSTRSHTTAIAPPPLSTQTSRQDRPQPNVQPPSTPSLVNEGETDPKAENSGANTTSLTLDWMNVCLKRASLIVSEHIVNQQRNSDTRQILNCSLRESTLVYERVLDRKHSLAGPNTGSSLRKKVEPVERTCNKLNLALGELEGDLPMHAESIHEVVLRHGPQINEQIHRIVGQPQPAAFATNVDHVETEAKVIRHPTLQNPPPPSSMQPLSSPSTPSTEYVSPSEGDDHLLVPPLEEEPSTTKEALVDDLIEPVLAAGSRMEIEFEIRLAGVELNVQLLPSLKAKYKLEKAISTGKSGESSDFFAEIVEHQLYFLVTSAGLEGSSNLPLDTFTLQLPRVCANGSFEVSSKQSKDDGWNSNELAYRNDGFYNIIILMGSMNHTFSTDLLNQILFAEQSFRAEFSFLLDRLSSERPKTAAGGAALLNVNPILFNLELKGEGVPWLQVTASTPTSTAIRFTIDSPHAVLTNRLTNFSATNETTEESKQSSSPIDRLFGRAKVQLNVKLGQLYKNALYEETQEELEEFANFMTQISVQNEESITKDSIHSYLISLNRPLLLIKSNAIDKAILLWLNYRNTYNYWREERNKLLVMSNRVYEKKRKKSTREMFGKLEQPETNADQKLGDGAIDGDRSSAPPSSSNFVTDMNINLSLSIPNGLYICMPLYSPEINDSMAALVVSLQKSDVTVCVKKELACLASFTAFKVTFIDNFDEQSLSEPWLAENAAGGESLHSNFFFFPHGSYSFCTSAISPSAHNQNAKWILCVKSHMQGMVIDFDYKIGKLTSLLIHTLSSFASDDDVVEEVEYAPSDSSFAYTSVTQPSRQQPRLSVQSSMDNNLTMDNQLNMMEDSQHFQQTLGELDEENEEFTRVVGHENKIRWLERKMHEQSVLVTDLISHRPRMSELMIEKERRKLRILELVRFKQFRQSMWDKIRQKVNTRTHHLSGNSSKNGDSISNPKVAQSQRQPSRSLLSANSSSTPAASSHSNLSPEYASGGSSATSKTPNQQQQINQASENVDMSIDIQINIECGQCFLRSNQPAPNGAGLRGLLTKKPSARDLKAKMGSLMGPGTQSVTKLSIPSLDARMFYTSNDAVTTPPLQIRQLFQARDKAKAAGATCLKNKCFYFSLELASMPLETLITPCLADFLEQVVEPLPESLFETAKSDSETSSNTNSLPIVAIDTSSLPLDVLFHMSVQSSSIRFEGQQRDKQRSSAADMLLTLPRLTLMASTRKYNEQDWTVAGIYLSATLSSFSLSIYSPHQQSSSHDALSLTLDKFSVTASRTKNPNNNEDDKNKVQLVIASNVGTANFNYDMRRLSELLTFPKPWYRKQLIRRLFFGEQSVAAAHAAASAKLQRYNSTSSTAAPVFKGNSQMRYGSDDLSSSNQEFQPKKGATPVKSVTSAAQLNQITWAASVIFSMQWKELNINAQMSNTMGNTQWLARQGILRVHLKLDSQRHRDVAVSFKLLSSELSAQGGAISGEVGISKLLISARHSKSSEKAPENVANLEFENIECRTEWMSRPIFIGKFAHPQIMITDEWKHICDVDTAEVSEAMCFVNISGSWTDLQMVITKNTVGDMIKIGDKLIIFFKDQLKNSKMVWGEEFDQRHRTSTSSDDDSSIVKSSGSQAHGHPKYSLRYGEEGEDEDSINGEGQEGSQSSRSFFLHHWHSLLDSITDVQLRKKFLPLPRSKDGVTVVGGNVELTAKRISLACMNGEMNASSWAFFHMSEVGVLFTSRSCYTFMDEKKTSLGVQTKQQFIFRLGEHSSSQFQSTDTVSSSHNQPHDFKAVVCRVQHNRGFLLRHSATIDHSLQAMIGDVLKQLSASSPNLLQGELEPEATTTTTSKAPPPRFTHNVLQLFQFPSLEAVLSSLQNQDFEEPRKRHSSSSPTGPSEMVHTSFVCDFKGGVGVQTDFNAQVSFLPELLKSYIVSQPDLADPSISSGERRSTPRKPMSATHSSSLLTSLGTSPSAQMHAAASGSVLQAHPNDVHPKQSISSATNKDPRQYVCVKWVVDPKIQFIDRFKWNPPVVDDILKKLQIFDHRRTIPKVMQRGVLDRCDVLLAAILDQILNQVKRG